MSLTSTVPLVRPRSSATCRRLLEEGADQIRRDERLLRERFDVHQLAFERHALFSHRTIGQRVRSAASRPQSLRMSFLTPRAQGMSFQQRYVVFEPGHGHIGFGYLIQTPQVSALVVMTLAQLFLYADTIEAQQNLCDGMISLLKLKRV